MVIRVGTGLRHRMAIYGANGVLINPTTLTYTNRKPDGTTLTQTIVSDGVGLKHVDYILSAVGRWKWKLVGVDPDPLLNLAVEGEFQVESLSF